MWNRRGREGCLNWLGMEVIFIYINNVFFKDFEFSTYSKVGDQNIHPYECQILSLLWIWMSNVKAETSKKKVLRLKCVGGKD